MMPNNPQPGADSSCQQNPWVVYMVRDLTDKWKPVARMDSKQKAWNHCSLLKEWLPNCFFDVVFEQPEPAPVAPAYQGHNRDLFLRDMESLCSQLVEVATDYRRDPQGPPMDPRTCLTGYVVTPTSNGFLMAVRESTSTPSHILHQAQELHQAVQGHYRTLGYSFQQNTALGDNH